MMRGMKIGIMALGLSLPLGAGSAFAAGGCASCSADEKATCPMVTMDVSAKTAVPAAAQEHIDQLATEYLAAQKLLAADTVEGVAADLENVQKHAKALAGADEGLKTQADAVAEAAGGEAKTLKEARETFKKVSAAAVALLKTAPPSKSVAGVFYDMHCPMAKADWLQSSKELANPYMGKKMAKCGTVKATIEAAPAGE